MFRPRYSGAHRSGTCVCGHSWEDHHLGMVMNREYADATQEAYLPQECEFYGSNEMGGLDADGHHHCSAYQDTLAPPPPHR
jgi:hypothetical protein